MAAELLHTITEEAGSSVKEMGEDGFRLMVRTIKEVNGVNGTKKWILTFRETSFALGAFGMTGGGGGGLIGLEMFKDHIA